MREIALRALPLRDRAMSIYLLNTKGTLNEFGLLVARVDAEGSPDASFGNGGYVSVSLDVPALGIFPVGMVPTDDGGVIAAVRLETLPRKLGLARFRADGRLDPSFGYDGIIIHDLPGTGSNANAVAPPQHDVGLLSYQETLSGGSRGEAAPAPGGGLYFAWNTGLGGPPPGGVLRTKPNGFLDTSFGDDGFVEVHYPDSPQTLPRGVQSLSDRSVVVFGALRPAAGQNEYPAFAARFLESGKLDRTFGTEGFAVLHGQDIPELDIDSSTFSSAVALPEGAIVLSGASRTSNDQGYGLLAAVDRLGKPLASFNGGRPVLFGLIGGIYESFLDGGIAVQDDGKIVVGGFSSPGRGVLPVDMLVARFLADGSIDTSFASPRGWLKLRPFGREYNYIWSLSLTADGKILVAGDAQEGPDPISYVPVVVRISS